MWSVLSRHISPQSYARVARPRAGAPPRRAVVPVGSRSDPGHPNNAQWQGSTGGAVFCNLAPAHTFEILGMIRPLASGYIYRNPRPHLTAVHAWHPSLVRLSGGNLLATFDLAQAVESLDYHTCQSRST